MPEVSELLCNLWIWWYSDDFAACLRRPCLWRLKGWVLGVFFLRWKHGGSRVTHNIACVQTFIFSFT